MKDEHNIIESVVLYGKHITLSFKKPHTFNIHDFVWDENKYIGEVVKKSANSITVLVRFHKKITNVNLLKCFSVNSKVVIAPI